MPIHEALLIAGFSIGSHRGEIFVDFSKEFDANICMR